MELRASCKINLGLRVVRRRGDGFHDIETVMIAVPGLCDTVSVTSLPFTYATPPPYFAPPDVVPENSVLEVYTAAGQDLDCPAEENICMRALRLLQREFGIGEAHIRLHKQIPSGAGLGGGSSDAAAVLRACDQEFALELTQDEIEKLGAELGSDVPFFLRASAATSKSVASARSAALQAQFCTSRGEVMTPVEADIKGLWIAILKPADTAVSTTEAYAGVTPREGSTTQSSNTLRRPDTPLPEILRRPIGEWKELMVNDFEASVFARHPEIGALKQSLYDTGALYASMSGSGSAVFGLFDRSPASLGGSAGGAFLDHLPKSVFRSVSALR